jgi:hypothetical protein
MRITKSEKLWLALTVIFYVLYNLPGVPAMEDAQGMKIHALLTVIPLWILAYAGMKKVYSVYKLKDQKTSKEANTNA